MWLLQHILAFFSLLVDKTSKYFEEKKASFYRHLIFSATVIQNLFLCPAEVTQAVRTEKWNLEEEEMKSKSRFFFFSPTSSCLARLTEVRGGCQALSALRAEYFQQHVHYPSTAPDIPTGTKWWAKCGLLLQCQKDTAPGWRSCGSYWKSGVKYEWGNKT